MLALWVCLGLTGCIASVVGDTKSTVQSDRFELEDVDALAAELECVQIWQLHDDVHFYDAMRGFDCWLGGDGPSLSFRAYEHDASPRQVLQYWDGLVSRERPYLIGPNWFTVGSPTDLKRFANAVGVEPVAYNTVPEAPPAVSLTQMNVGICTTAIVTWAEEVLIFHKDASDSFVGQETVFPGIRDAVGSIIGEIERTGGTTAETFNYDITEYGPAMKTFCETAVRRTP
jgi:hypothetical protein